MALGKDFEQQLSSGQGQRHKSEFIDNQQLHSGKLLLKAQPALPNARCDELVGQGSSGGEQDRLPALSRSHAETQGKMAFANPELPTAITFSWRPQVAVEVDIAPDPNLAVVPHALSAGNFQAIGMIM